MNTPITGPRAYLPAVQNAHQGASSKRPAEQTGAEFNLDLDGAVTPAEWKALAESFGTPATPVTPPTRKTSTGEFRGRHLDIRA